MMSIVLLRRQIGSMICFSWSSHHRSVIVPVSVPSVTVSVCSFSSLAPASQVSPLQLDQIQTELEPHPDQAAVAYVLSGIHKGFCIGFESSMANLKSASSNIRSSFEHPFVIDSYL